MSETLNHEAQIAEYLQNHPEFFERHPSLLHEIRLTSPYSQRTVSLLERQVEALRAKVKHMEKSLMQLIQNANDSGAIADAMFQWFENVLRLHDLTRRRNYIEHSLAQRFKLESVRIVLFQDDPAPSEALLAWAHSLRAPWCGSPSRSADTPAVVVALHSDVHAQLNDPSIASLAVLPLIRADGSCMGLLVLGSSSEQRFHQGIGSELITRMAMAVTAALEPEVPLAQEDA